MSGIKLPMTWLGNTVARLQDSFDSLLSSKEFMKSVVGEQKSVQSVIDELVEKENRMKDFVYENKCENCGKQLGHRYYTLTKQNEEEVEIIEEYEFCSADCLDAYRKDKDKEQFAVYQVDRCSTYFGCLKLDNLRGICERKERLDYIPPMPGISSLTNFCDPANAALIKSTLLIDEQIEKFAKLSGGQFKTIKWMTILVILLTLSNVVIGAIQLWKTLQPIIS